MDNTKGGGAHGSEEVVVLASDEAIALSTEEDVGNPVQQVLHGNKLKANEIELELKEWKTNKEDCQSFLENKTIMNFADYISKYDSEIKKKKEEEEIVIICTIVNIPYQVRKYNNEKFIFWDISDLQNTQSRIFLTGEICEQFQAEKEGAVIALVNPVVKDKDPQYYNSRLLEVLDKTKLKVIGLIDKLERCKGRKRNGESCKIVIYTPLFGHFCKYHVKQDRTKRGKKKYGKSGRYVEVGPITWDEGEQVAAVDEVNEADGKENGSSTTTTETEKNKRKKKKKKEDTGGTGGTDATGGESFDIESIIGMYTNKIEVKDKKKKKELVENRIKELDNFSKLTNDGLDLEILSSKEPTEKEEVATSQKSANDILTKQCPELIHLINKSNKADEDEQEVSQKEKLRIKEESRKKKEQLAASNEEKQKRKFENFLVKLIELQKSKDENDVKTLLKGLIYVTNNFQFNLKHVSSSNIFDVCYKLMDHRNEDVAIAALKFKRKINTLYIDYYKDKLKRQKVKQSKKDGSEAAHVEVDKGEKDQQVCT
ncbi:conserved Plasmodium protein, unknown function [Plasmodium knowlesi strain H]|uniref:Uncharacterized protein n=3 Tax=Plasmodium knowlesi TaxID=5850 RepID=A0A5K1UD19_PLAKH|nr:conserved Plasmodium protein, unknown function [Plasmodium knowlesi strain H]OTN65547.1 Uncharacterized protein PKNOH_S110077800 [Plasmodium knowlesi]CAA9989399.1 conserved Plasmodium protein, unknown function [Plasmodium knowlesi strain H]SBO24998.1 conserved Plasmodium protein, unknown function [Plasmodium knowlesi strain H]SBO27873.1 conserved Plasmodium protein, unknown function [Plasmodium knowlesi strain H]VVS78873.1 conserved Plasmodium protein, unknown function [Plasmodium knowlesi |eukprot:XP_002260126.1 hypothetical protein, conserved in Plasmodium species [Plasmodium knowlesi strain H]